MPCSVFMSRERNVGPPEAPAAPCLGFQSPFLQNFQQTRSSEHTLYLDLRFQRPLFTMGNLASPRNGWFRGRGAAGPLAQGNGSVADTGEHS